MLNSVRCTSFAAVSVAVTLALARLAAVITASCARHFIYTTHTTFPLPLNAVQKSSTNNCPPSYHGGSRILQYATSSVDASKSSVRKSQFVIFRAVGPPQAASVSGVHCFPACVLKNQTRLLPEAPSFSRVPTVRVAIS